MKCQWCGKDRSIWVMDLVLELTPYDRAHKMKCLLLNRQDKPSKMKHYKCYNCLGLPISKVMQTMYNIDETGNYLGVEMK
jgi:hypothetical protein